ncbi:porin [Basilea psittacipulmonis]|uniref:Porin domain-containing protein n=1 Tax=Basilea psittacipulmonis DSM 24701 TaxID=1072685 RepID=A0A077DE96_9BURK|nr:porin [Basilea psittacipulmonis]AIL33024.1 hypothetical protein IX83_06590 [Basilea psittacipulmonis DSM 24701]
MKKTLIAVAVATSLAGVASADSVTVYGLLDGGLGFKEYSLKTLSTGAKVKTKEFGVTDGHMSGNRFGFKGVEDLGNGTKVAFDLEGGFTLADGKSGQGTRLFGRKATVGIVDADLGAIYAGRQHGAVGHTTFDEGFGDTFYHRGTGLFGNATGTRQDSNVRYKSPDLGGATLQLSWSGTHKTEGTKSTHKDHVQAAVDFKLDALKVAAGLIYTKDNTAKTNHFAAIGAVNYDFGPVALYTRVAGGKLAGGVNGLLGNAFYAGTDDTMKKNRAAFDKLFAWSLGLSAPVSDSGKLMFAFEHGTEKQSAGNGKLKGWNLKLAYTEALSKRTTAYAGAYYAVGKEYVGGNATRKYKGLEGNIGLRHRF